MPAHKTAKWPRRVHHNNPILGVGPKECLNSRHRRTHALESLFRSRQLIIIFGEYSILSFR